PGKFSRLLAVLAALIVTAAYFYVVRESMLPFWRGGRLRKYSAAEWTDALSALPPEPQAIRLRLTTAETVGLTPSDFLQLLVAIEHVIGPEPAVSAYWAKRYETEQIVRHEAGFEDGRLSSGFKA